MKTIGIFTSGYGHESIAEAIKEQIVALGSDKYLVKVFYQKAIFNLAYNSLYRLSPQSLGPIYYTMANLFNKDKRLKKTTEALFLSSYKNKITRFIKKNKVDLCISTYFPYNAVLEEIQEKKQVPLINILTDPKTTHPLAISELAKSTLVFDQNSEIGQLPNPVKPSGWFVRERFQTHYEQREVRTTLKLTNQLTILLVSGSEGANAVLKILPSIINCNKPTNFIVVCGKNKFLYNNVLGIKQSLEKLSSSKAKLIPLAFTKNLHQYMQAADLVIGKAGPNTLFESVATETPFFAITHIHGQEDGNLDIIKDYQLGFVEENAAKANRKLTAILRKPEVLHKFTPHLQALKKYNQQAGQVLME